MRSLNVLWQNSTGGAALGGLRRVLLAAGMVFCAAGLAAAGTLTGSVTNGTTRRPVPGVEVTLLELKSGMVPVGKVKTDARGHFKFTSAAAGQEPMLLETSYRGVSYYASVSAGDNSAALQVFDSTRDPKAILVASHAIMLRPKGANLEVEEQYVVENMTKPPVAFYVKNGTFTFPVPEGAKFGQVSTWTSSRLPTLQKTMDKPQNRKAIDWAFRPGKNIVRISYLFPYASNQAVIRTQSPYSATHVFVAVPPGVKVASDGFNMLGTEQGFNVYARQSVPAETALAISVSGVASAAAAPGAPGAQGAQGAATDASVSTLPGRYRNLTWILAVSLAVLLFVVSMFIWRRSSAQQAVATAGAGMGPGASGKGKGKGKQKRPAAESPASGADGRLDQIKDRLLQLELRHQAGTLSDEDYSQERQQVEETLRELLKA
jgi:hypothetical protein